jgi:hypothetical protein
LAVRAEGCVSQPNQQSAFLQDRSEFYVGAALAAFRQQAWDKLLAAMELMKARAALRNRLVGAAPDVSEADLLAVFAEVSTKLHKATSDEDAAVLERERRRLWDRRDYSPARPVQRCRSTLRRRPSPVPWRHRRRCGCRPK